MLTYVASIPLSTRSLTRLTTLINAHRRELGGRWQALPAQALMSLAHLRNGDTLARLAAGFGIGRTTVWRYLRAAIDLLGRSRRRRPPGRQAGLRDLRRHPHPDRPGC